MVQRHIPGDNVVDDAKRKRRAVVLLIAAAIVAMTLYQVLRRMAPASEDAVPAMTLQDKPRRLPDIRFLDERGRPDGLQQHRGKVVLLNIWATWCPPCRKEMPSLDRLQAEVGGNDFEVIALSIDKGENSADAVRSFYASLGLTHLRVYRDPEGQAGFDLGAVGVPATLLLDRDGREIGRMSGPAAWDSAESVAMIRRHMAGEPNK